MQDAHWLLLGSLAIFLMSVIALPAVLIFLPPDYFVRDHNPTRSPLRHHPVLRALLLVVKNLAGLLLFAAGLLMLFTPGQGILGMLAGLWLMDFPGKRSLERRMVSRPMVFKALNRLRRQFGRPPLERPT
jgi:hypothetical protein